MTSIDELKDEVNSLSASISTMNSLNSILDAAQANFDQGKNEKARTGMEDFMAVVVKASNLKAGQSKRVPPRDANSLTCGASNVLIGIPLP